MIDPFRPIIGPGNRKPAKGLLEFGRCCPFGSIVFPGWLGPSSSGLGPPACGTRNRSSTANAAGLPVGLRPSLGSWRNNKMLAPNTNTHQVQYRLDNGPCQVLFAENHGVAAWPQAHPAYRARNGTFTGIGPPLRRLDTSWFPEVAVHTATQPLAKGRVRRRSEGAKTRGRGRCRAIPSPLTVCIPPVLFGEHHHDAAK